MRSISKLFLCSLLAASLVACGDDDGDGNGNGNGGVADAAVEADAAPEADAAADDDGGSTSTCAPTLEPVTTLSAFPANYAGTVTGAGADLAVAGEVCADERAPFGVAAVGEDQVVEITDLTPGSTYALILESAEDLAFYVVTSCEDLAPAAGECLLFVDEATDAERGEFVAPEGGTVYVVVDHWDEGPLADAAYTLDVLEVECTTSYDCTDPALAFCDVGTYACTAGPDMCTGDDDNEPNDGPAAATDVTPAVGESTTTNSQICNTPATETDFYQVTVEDGDNLDITVSWAEADTDLDLYVYDETGELYGLTFWSSPEVVSLSNLAAGTYYFEVQAYVGIGAPAFAYTVTVDRSAGGCTVDTDCDDVFETQIFRGSCDVATGACNAIDGAGAVADGGSCDSPDDCSGGACSYSLFQSNAAASVCTVTCAADADCAVVGEGYICSVGFATNVCMASCAVNTDCGVNPNSDTLDADLPWDYFVCTVDTGSCGPE